MNPMLLVTVNALKSIENMALAKVIYTSILVIHNKDIQQPHDLTT